MRILLCGALGRMGKEVEKCIAETDDISVAARVDRCCKKDADGHLKDDMDKHSKKGADRRSKAVADGHSKEGAARVENIYDDVANVREDFDAIIDFSAHNATISILKVAIVRRCGVVVATTGHDDEEKKYIEYASRFIPIFYSGNMSLGIAAMARCVGETLRLFKKADVEIIETHHVQKLDAPSGTALMLADVVKRAIGGRIVLSRCGYGAKEDGDIGVHSLRMGGVFGVHEVRINTGSEVMEFKHEALSRSVYAKGAIEAVRFIKNKGAGLYGMADLLRQ